MELVPIILTSLVIIIPFLIWVIYTLTDNKKPNIVITKRNPDISLNLNPNPNSSGKL